MYAGPYGTITAHALLKTWCNAAHVPSGTIKAASLYQPQPIAPSQANWTILYVGPVLTEVWLYYKFKMMDKGSQRIMIMTYFIVQIKNSK